MLQGYVALWLNWDAIYQVCDAMGASKLVLSCLRLRNKMWSQKKIVVVYNLEF
jgi:hypothetical protein